jgi:hypothetical protein
MATASAFLAPAPDGGGADAAATPRRSPLSEDSAAHQVAESLGFEVVRSYRGIEIYDERALIAAGLTVTKPKLDYSRIGKMLEAGIPVEGARWRGFEYVLRGSEGTP